MINITNRSNTTCILNVPEFNYERYFQPGESQSIDEKILEKLLYDQGYQDLLSDNFIIGSKEFAKTYVSNCDIDPEYWMTEKDIIDLIKNGSIDEFLDFLDFAPKGGIEILKAQAIALPITDMKKIQILKDTLGIDVIKILNFNQQNEGQEQVAEEPQGKKRRSRR